MEYKQFYPRHNAIQSGWEREMDGQDKKEGQKRREQKADI